jgi:hypothetical protein
MERQQGSRPITSCDHSIPYGIRWIHVNRYLQLERTLHQKNNIYENV